MSAELGSPTVSARHDQAFPVLAAEEIERLVRFGSPRDYASGDRLYETGKPSPGMFVVLAGSVRVTGRDGHGHDVVIVEHGPGTFSGELGQLSGRRAFVDAVAVGDVRSVLIAPERLRALLIAEAALGEKIMRALILRRVGLIETGVGGPILVGSASSPDVARLASFLTRNGIPHLVLDPETDAEARLIVDRYSPSPDELPLALCPDGSISRNPAESALARCIGMLDAAGEDRVYDVAIVGAGPAGLSAAVYAASEGLAVIVLDARAFGGQAGASMRIENYLGFPTGISGQALAGRAFTQAQKFGARVEIPAEVVDIDCRRCAAANALALDLADGSVVRSRTVVIASGVRYRRPNYPRLAELEGRGVWYWASPIEAKVCAGQEVVLVGGGNSAGQAAVYLSGAARKVWMLVRGPGLAASMSKYLIDRIGSIANIELLTNTEIVDLIGSHDAGVEFVTWRAREGARETTRPVRNVFLFLGADPRTEWLASCGIALDPNGFVKTGEGGAPLETNVPGVFAIGDVRSGSVKRVGGAIGEGAAVVAQIHAALASGARRRTGEVAGA
jgi:thioredoxin reductase (NADPH)